MGQTWGASITELVIDVDTHVTEPPDTFVARVPAKLKDRVPRVERTEGGRPCTSPGSGGRRPLIVGQA